MKKAKFFPFLIIISILSFGSLFFRVPKVEAWWKWHFNTRAISYIDGGEIRLEGIEVYLCSSGCDRDKSGNNCTSIHHTNANGQAIIDGGSSFSCNGACGGWCHECVRIPEGYDFPTGTSTNGYWEHRAKDNNVCNCEFTPFEKGSSCQVNTNTIYQNLTQCGFFRWISEVPPTPTPTPTPTPEPPLCENLTADPTTVPYEGGTVDLTVLTSPNLVENGSFEDGLSGWRRGNVHWAVYSTGSISGDSFLESNQPCAVCPGNCGELACNDYSFFQDISIAGLPTTGSYILSLWAKARAPANINVGVWELETQTFHSEIVNLGTEWQHIYIPFTLTQGSIENLRVQVYLRNPGINYDFDGVSLVGPLNYTWGSNGGTLTPNENTAIWEISQNDSPEPVTYTAWVKVSNELGESGCDGADSCTPDDGGCVVSITQAAFPEKFLNCENLIMFPTDPKVDDTVKFTCVGSSYLDGDPGAPIVRVRFRIYRDYVLIHEEEVTDVKEGKNEGEYTASLDYTIEEAGYYSVVSSVCLSTAAEDPENTLCTDFAAPNGGACAPCNKLHVSAEGQRGFLSHIRQTLSRFSESLGSFRVFAFSERENP